MESSIGTLRIRIFLDNMKQLDMMEEQIRDIRFRMKAEAQMNGMIIPDATSRAYEMYARLSEMDRNILKRLHKSPKLRRTFNKLYREWVKTLKGEK